MGRRGGVANMQRRWKGRRRGSKGKGESRCGVRSEMTIGGDLWDEIYIK